MITTLIVDDERLAREGIRLALEGEADVKIVGEAADGPAAVKAISKLALVFLDTGRYDSSDESRLPRPRASSVRCAVVTSRPASGGRPNRLHV